MKNSTKYLKEILDLLGKQRFQLVILIALFFLSASLDVLGLGLIAPYVTVVIDPTKLENLYIWNFVDLLNLSLTENQVIIFLGIVLLTVYLAKGIAAFFISRAILKFSWAQQLRLRKLLMHSYQNLPYDVYSNSNSSEYIQTILNNTITFSFGVIVNGLKVVSDGIVALSIVMVLAYVDPVALGFFVALVGGTAVGYDRLFRRKLKHYGERSIKASENITRAVQESFRGFKEIRILGVGRLFLSAIDVSSKEYANVETYRVLIMGLPKYVFDFALFLFVVSLVTISIVLGNDVQNLVPVLSVFGVAALRLIPAASSLSKSIIEFRYYRYLTGRLHLDVQRSKALPPVNEDTRTDGLAGDQFETLTVKNINFVHQGVSQPILRNLSFEIAAGDSIGIVGRSGTGKTTFIDVILGLLEPQEGAIYFNGEPLKEQMENWWSQVAYLPQEIFIIDDTISRNVALGSSDIEIDQGRLYDALRQAQLLTLIEELPLGVATLVGENGMRLSGGQRQRIAIARAIYHDRKVLIMDEATSSLDLETERVIVDEIESFKGKLTMIVIAHRKTMVKNCDRIYRLEDGQLVEVR
jgi:ABC-type multidrug transport system fused ATPase/permease subunit